MSITRIAFVRHGETDWNLEGRIQGTTDNALNASGRAQGRAAGSVLARIAEEVGEPWEYLLSSSLLRARETAALISQIIEGPGGGSIPVGVDARFVERDYGAVEGWLVSTATCVFPNGDYPGSERSVDVTERALAGLDALQAHSCGKSSIVVAHGGLLRSLLRRVTGEEIPELRNASVSVIQREGPDEVWRAASLNEAG